MSRYTGPRVRILRRLGGDLPGLSRKRSHRIGTMPGQQHFRRGRLSAYGERLREKQRLRYNFGVTERQMRRLYKEAARQQGDTGLNLITLLEQRLDSLVYRAGFAPTIPAARQMVSHGHILLDGKKVDVASCQVKPGQTIAIRERVRQKEFLKERSKDFGIGAPSFLQVDPSQFTVTLVAKPTTDEFQIEVNSSLVVEFYSR